MAKERHRVVRTDGNHLVRAAYLRQHTGLFLHENGLMTARSTLFASISITRSRPLTWLSFQVEARELSGRFWAYQPRPRDRRRGFVVVISKYVGIITGRYLS